MTVPPNAMLHRCVAVAALGLIAVGVGACVGTPGATSTTTATASAGATASLAAKTEGDTPSPIASASPDVNRGSAPPAATLVGVDGRPVAGDLGSFSWDDLASDSPWIVERVGHPAAPGARLRATFDGSLDQVAWTARWAPIRHRQVRTPLSAGSGRDERIIVDAPNTAGPWSLQLEATFGDGRRAVWYWRVEVDG